MNQSFQGKGLDKNFFKNKNKPTCNWKWKQQLLKVINNFSGVLIGIMWDINKHIFPTTYLFKIEKRINHQRLPLFFFNQSEFILVDLKLTFILSTSRGKKSPKRSPYNDIRQQTFSHILRKLLQKEHWVKTGEDSDFELFHPHLDEKLKRPHFYDIF